MDVGTNSAGVERQAELLRNGARRAAPSLAFRPRAQEKRAAGQVDGRGLFAVALQPEVRRARAGAAEGLARVVVDLVLAILRMNRRRPIEIAELDVEVVGERLEVLGAKVGRGARHVTGIGLFDREFADRLALGLI